MDKTKKNPPKKQREISLETRKLSRSWLWRSTQKSRGANQKTVGTATSPHSAHVPAEFASIFPQGALKADALG